MGAPTTKGLSILIRNTELSDDERIQLVEARRELLVPHLNNITLPELGSVRCVCDDLGQHPITTDNPIFEDEGNPFTLKSQGIYRVQDYQMNTVLLWGLVRSGEWVVARVHYKGFLRDDFLRRDKAERVSMRSVSLHEMLAECQMSPNTVLFELERLANQVLEHRKRLYDSALQLVHIIQAEGKALDLLNDKTGFWLLK